MASNVNRIRNPEFRAGRGRPAWWKWRPGRSRAKIERILGTDGCDARLRITCPSAAPGVFVSQEVSCLPGKFYRVEAVIACDAQHDAHEANDRLSSLTPSPSPLTPLWGCILQVEPLPLRSKDAVRTSPPISKATEPITVRQFFQVPPGCRRVRVSVGLVNVAGWLEIHTVRWFRILEPEYSSHPFAVSVPSHLAPAPKTVERVWACATNAESRPLTKRLRESLGPDKVATCRPEDVGNTSASLLAGIERMKADALLFVDPTLPPGVRDLSTLLRLSRDRCVIVSLSAFAKISGGALVVRKIEQPDDPIHARVTLGNHATRGFMLHDTFPYAWSGKALGSYCQHQFRKTQRLAAFCKKHGLVTMLESLCDKDETSYQPIALYRESRGGGLYVIDLNPVETPASTMGEPALAMHLLLSTLGHEQTLLCQYFTPVRTEPALREMVRELAVRFESVRVYDAEVPSAEVSEQIVTVGRDDQMFGLPVAPRPVILIRTGLRGGDAESFYGAWVWLKQLVRPPPHACPYAQQLASQFRLAWVPCVAPWRSGDGWQRSGIPPRTDTMIEVEKGGLAAMIDVVSLPVNRVRVVLPAKDANYAHIARWLPSLLATFGCGLPSRHFSATDRSRHAEPAAAGKLREASPVLHGAETRVTSPLAPHPSPLLPARYTWSMPPSAPFADRSVYAWRFATTPLEIVAEPQSFADRAYQDAIAAGATVIRLEVPGYDADFVAQSIARTDLTATLLEQIVGLQFGLIAVNRTSRAIHFDGFPPTAPGAALIADRNAPALRLQIPHAG